MSGKIAVFILAAALAACGANRIDRAISGGAIGAGVGAAGALLTDRDVVSGAVLGGLVGAAAGGLTDAQDFDLGEPIYRSGY